MYKIPPTFFLHGPLRLNKCGVVVMATAYIPPGVIRIPAIKPDISCHTWKTRSTLSCVTPTIPQREEE